MQQPDAVGVGQLAGQAGARAYWRTQLAGLGVKTCFPIDLQPGGGRAEQTITSVHRAALPHDLAARLIRASRDEPSSLHALLAAGLVALLGRYTGESDVAIGQPTLGGGNLMMVLRAAPDGSLRELLARLRETIRNAIAHQEYPVWTLADELGRSVAAGEDPYVDVAIALAGLHSAEFADTTRVPVLFTVSRQGAQISVAVRYDATRFTRTSITRIVRHYGALLDAALVEPDRPLANIDLWTADDEAIGWAGNDTRVAFDDRATIHDLLTLQAAATPRAVALLDGDVRVTYAELDARTNRLARLLRERGVRPDQAVGVLADRSIAMIVAIWAILKAGGAYVPVDPTYPRARIRYLLDDSQAPLVLARAGVAGLASPAAVIDLDDPATYAGSADPLESTGTSTDLAYVMYTSGSTGQPKGVQIEHRSVINRLAWMQRAYPIGSDDVLLQKTPISFDVSVWELFWPAMRGAALALLEPGGEKDPAVIAATVKRHHVSTIHFVPSMMNLFLGHVERFGTADRLTSLRHIFASGEALAPGHARRLGAVVPQAVLVNLYGPTEATVDVTHHAVGTVDGLARVPIGRPIDNMRAYVLDAAGHRAPIGVPGQLNLAGVGLARGYLRRPQLTAEMFVGGAAVGEDRLYRTGDRARLLDDGSLDYLGRVDHQVKVRGFRVEPAEIEERLRGHSAVDDAAVVAHDDGWQTTLHAYVVARAAATEAELKAYVGEALPEHCVPARIMLLDVLPLTPNGKLDRGALRRRPPARAVVAPRDDREQTLAAIWRDVLGIDTVGVFDNFFALGGNSIHFVTVLAKARAVGLDFTFQQLFEHQTVAALSARLSAASVGDTGADTGAASGDPGAGDTPGDGQAGGADAGVSRPPRPFELISAEDRAGLPDGVQDAYPLSMLQAGLIFQTEVTGGLGQYHDVLSYMVHGEFDAPAFTAAVSLLTRRHPILRTTYHLTGFSEFVQVVRADVPAPLSIVDVRNLSPDEQERHYEQWLAAEKRRSFVWWQGQLVSLHIQILADDRYRYTVSQHNSALDGWSISVLHTQLFEAYFQVRDRAAGDLAEGGPPDPENHVASFVALERAAMRSSVSREFWLAVLRGAVPTRMPRQRAGEAPAGFRVVLRDVTLPAGLGARVSALAETLSVPVKDVLLAAHVKVLSVVAATPDVLTGYEHSGRPELPGADAALGLFLNTVPLRVSVAGGSWSRLVDRIYRAELALLPHRRYPMAMMKQDLGTREDLFETTFNFTHFYLLKRLRELPGFALVSMRVDSETEFVFRTEFSLDSFDDDLRLCLHYHDHVCDTDQIDEIGRWFVRALQLMTEQPEAAHDAVPLGDARELRGLPAREPLASELPAPELPAPDGASGHAVMRRIAALWARVLDRPASDIGAADDFFALGGNSLSALRVVLEADGLVTLTDLTSHPRLSDLAVRVERRRRRDRPHPPDEGPHLLRSLSPRVHGVARCALVCVPYPCGHPINFRPLAEALGQATDDIAVYALEQPDPGPDEREQTAAVVETARRAAEEIAADVGLPVLLWGHCGGAAVAAEVGHQLEQRDHDLRAVLIGSKLLPPIEEMLTNIDTIEGWSDDDVIRYLVEETGYRELDGIDAKQAGTMARTFRHEVCSGYRYLIDTCQRQAWRLAAPFTSVVAADDPGLASRREAQSRWRLIATDVRTHVLGSGGHYFVRANPAGTAELIVEAWRASLAGERDRQAQE